jgi:hypothetical protein
VDREGDRRKREEHAAGPVPAYRFEWRGGFDNAAVNALHAEAFGYEEPSDGDWEGRVREHSLGWACARDREDELVGFVNVAWDGGAHAFVLDTMVGARAQRQGVGARLVALPMAG